jgi:hypothetical protein
MEAMVSETRRLLEYAERLLDATKGSETFLEEVMKGAGEELKRVYVDEAKKLADKIAESKLRKMERDESRLGPTGVKIVYGIAAEALRNRAEQDETARTLQEGLHEGYTMDETEKRKVVQACFFIKQRLEEEMLGMTPEEFLRWLKDNSVREVINAMFRQDWGYVPSGEAPSYRRVEG